MSLDPTLVEAAIRRKDARAVRDLFADATDADRRACAKGLKDLLHGPGIPDYRQMMMSVPRLAYDEHLRPVPPSAELLREVAEHNREVARHQDRLNEQQRAYQEWRKMAASLAFRLAALGVAGGVSAAARALEELSHSFDEAGQDDDLIIAVLADRRPDWLADLIDRHLKQGVLAEWSLARGLVRIGAIARPSVAEYTTLMPHALERGGFPTPERALLADPGLLDDEVWRLFTVPDAGVALETADYRGPENTDQTWSQALARLSAEGYLDRARLIDACLDAFTRDFNPNRVSWYATMLAELDVSVDEMASRQSKYLGLLASTSKTGVTVGQAGASRLLDAGRLDAARLLAASAPALLFPQKSIATAQLKLIDKLIVREPAAKAQATAAVALAFGHDRQDIQEAALALIAKHGVPSGSALDEIRSRVPDLSPALAMQAAALGLSVDQAKPADGDSDEVAELERRVIALPAKSGLAAALSAVRRGEVPGPAEFKPDAGAELPPPITDPDELIHLLSILIEDAGDALSVERALSAAVRLSALPQRQRRLAAAPLLKRAQAVMHGDEPFAGDVIASDIALITWAWAGERLPSAARDDGAGFWSGGGHSDYAVGGTGRALTMAGIFSARAWEAGRMIESGRGGLLLAEPETDRGTISPERLLERVELLARQGEGLRNPFDRDVALLRLAPGATDALWRAWATLDGTTAEAVRDTYLAITTPLRFEPVAGPPVESEIWRLYLDPVLLARTIGPVPVAAGCPSWQLLTRLGDPLADYVALTDIGRYWSNHDEAVAGWSIMCPWQPELAAAHLLRPLSEGLTSRATPATAAIRSLHHRGHALGLVGHLALIVAMSGIDADTRIAAAELWAEASADGRLDPALAAAALSAGADSKLVKLNRVAESMDHAASHSALAARRVVETVCAAPDLIAATPPNLHRLLELVARLGSSFGVPALPAGLRELGTRRGGARLNITAAQIVNAAEGRPAGQRQAAVQALTALIRRAES